MRLIKELRDEIWNENIYAFKNVENNYNRSGLVIRIRNNTLIAKYYNNEKGMDEFFMRKNRKYKL